MEDKSEPKIRRSNDFLPCADFTRRQAIIGLFIPIPFSRHSEIYQISYVIQFVRNAALDLLRVAYKCYTLNFIKFTAYWLMTFLRFAAGCQHSA